MLNGELIIDPLVASMTTTESALEDISRNLLVDVAPTTSPRDLETQRKRDQLLTKMRFLGYSTYDMRIVPVNRHARHGR